MLWDDINAHRQAEYPDTHFVRFVARNYYGVEDRADVYFLDLGCGRHARNTRFLSDKGFEVTAVDFSQVALAHIHADINDLDFPRDSFDCIFDINTLCHVENPPMEKIRSWLKPYGLFFSIAPCHDTWRDHLEGKGYCRCADLEEIVKLHANFRNFRAAKASYPHGDHQITSWIVEATK